MEVLFKDVMKWKPLLFCHLAIVVLLGSFLWPVTRAYWEIVDVAVFKFLNGTLLDHPWVQLFWAFVNHKKADLVEDAIFLFFFILAVVKAPQDQKIRRTAQFIFTVLLAGTLIYFVNRTLLREHVLIPRESPSLVVTPCVRLSQEIPWLTIKDETVACFPGDHATTLFLFAVLYTFFAGKRLGIYACLYAVFRLLPRLIVGAHWFTDIVVGTTCLVLFLLSWSLCTPLHTWMIDKIERLMKLFAHETKKDLV
jgi:membrane-associated phospholipid phosphatase